jgi:hypothetical protein
MSVPLSVTLIIRSHVLNGHPVENFFDREAVAVDIILLKASDHLGRLTTASYSYLGQNLGR